MGFIEKIVSPTAGGHSTDNYICSLHDSYDSNRVCL